MLACAIASFDAPLLSPGGPPSRWRSGPTERGTLNQQPIASPKKGLRTSSLLDRLAGPHQLLALPLIGAPLAIGGVHLPAIVGGAALSAIALLRLAVDRGSERRRLTLGLLGAGLLGLVVITFLQWVPLPAMLLDLLMPATRTRPLLAAADTLIRMSDLDRLARLVDQLDIDDTSPALARAQLHRLRSHLAEGRGDRRTAAKEMHLALLFAPDTPAFAVRLATIYEAMGDERSAAAALARAGIER